MDKRQSAEDTLRWRFGEMVLDERDLSLTAAGQSVTIQPKPLELLIFILHRGGEICTKNELLEALWPGRIVGEGSLTNCVAKLRQALGDEEQTIIRRVHGYGYRLGVAVKVESVEAAVTASRLELAAGMAVPRRAGWTLVEQLGEGSTGEVWLSRGKMGEQRVIKFCTHADRLGSLKREVTLSRLLHDSLGERDDLAQLLDWNFEEPPYYLESVYYADGNLAQWLGRQSVWPALEHRIEWIAQAADALAAAHSLGVLHKDLKPSNLLVETVTEGRVRVRLSDWGSGRVLDLERLRASAITRLGFTRTEIGGSSTGGTPMYQAPEVSAGQAATIQADIYALGVMLYQLAVGNLHKPLAHGWERDIDHELLREDIAAASDGDATRRLTDAAELARRLRTFESRRAERASLGAAHRAAKEAQARAERESLEAQLALDRLRLRRRWMSALIIVLTIGLSATGWAAFQMRAALLQFQEFTALIIKDLVTRVLPPNMQAGDASVRPLVDGMLPLAESRFKDSPLARVATKRAIAEFYAALGDYPTARTLLEQTLADAKENIGADQERTGWTRTSLLRVYERQHDLKAYEAMARELLKYEREGGRPNSEDAIRGELGTLTIECAPVPVSDACAERYQALLERSSRLLGPRDPTSLDIAFAHSMALPPEQAKLRWPTLVSESRASLGDNHPLTLRATAAAAFLNGDASAKIVILTDLRNRLSRMYGESYPDIYTIDRQLGEAYLDAGATDAALPPLQRAYKWQVTSNGADSDEAGTTLKLIKQAQRHAERTQ